MSFKCFADADGLVGRRDARKLGRVRSLGGAAKSFPANDGVIPGMRATTKAVGLGALPGIEAYWRDKIGMRRVPLRRDIDPAGLATALPAAMILERIAPGIARIRVAGQQIERICGMDPRGMPLSVFFEAGSRDYLGAHIECAFAGPALVSLPLSVPRRLLRRAITGQLLILPLDDGTGAITRALAVLVTDAEISGRSPLRFGIPPSLPLRCEVLPVPARREEIAGAATPLRVEPSVSETRERRQRRTDQQQRFRLFEVVDGHGTSGSTLTSDRAPSRTPLSLVVSNT